MPRTRPIPILAPILALTLALAGCAAPPPPAAPPPQVVPGAAETARRLQDVADRVTPVATGLCQQVPTTARCDFVILLDDRPGQPPNAFQTLDPRGRPVLLFTAALVAQTRNDDELAFVFGHEAAHHIAGHIPATQGLAQAGAALAGALAGLGGADAGRIRLAQDLGATLAARSFSKEFELEADALGARIAWAAGYDPLRGAAYFTRVPDPGDLFLGTHPPNARRIETVRRAVATLPPA